jgi:hypothetical protein
MLIGFIGFYRNWIPLYTKLNHQKMEILSKETTCTWYSITVTKEEESPTIESTMD